MPKTTSYKFVGPPNTPQDVKRLRRMNMDLCRKLGQPIIWRHMYDEDDVEEGEAKNCPACYNDVYDQVRNDCPVCYGFGFASTEDNPLPIWVTTEGLLVEGGQPSGSVRAPRYGGFAVPYLTWMVEPDVAVDVFQINKQGVMIQTFDAQGVAPWFPKMGDNDLCVNVALEKDGFTIAGDYDRFQLKKVQQITVRGFGKRARYGTDGQPYLVAQSFQMAKAPTNTSLYRIPLDDPWY